MIVGYQTRAKEVNLLLVWVVKEVEYSLPFPDDRESFFLPTHSLWKASETEESDSEIWSVGEYCLCHLLCNIKCSKSFFLAAAKIWWISYNHDCWIPISLMGTLWFPVSINFRIVFQLNVAI